MALLDEVRLSLGISHSKMDAEIEAARQAAGAALKMAGAKAGPESFDGGAIYAQAVKMYCRSWFNYQGQGERWATAFEALKCAISLCGLYEEA